MMTTRVSAVSDLDGFGNCVTLPILSSTCQVGVGISYIRTSYYNYRVHNYTENKLAKIIHAARLNFDINLNARSTTISRPNWRGLPRG